MALFSGASVPPHGLGVIPADSFSISVHESESVLSVHCRVPLRDGTISQLRHNPAERPRQTCTLPRDSSERRHCLAWQGARTRDMRRRSRRVGRPQQLPNMLRRRRQGGSGGQKEHHRRGNVVKRPHGRFPAPPAVRPKAARLPPGRPSPQCARAAESRRARAGSAKCARSCTVANTAFDPHRFTPPARLVSPDVDSVFFLAGLHEIVGGLPA